MARASSTSFWIRRFSGRAPNEGGQPLLEQPHLDVDDARDLVLAQGVEHHELVDPVQELGREGLPDLRQHRFPLALR